MAQLRRQSISQSPESPPPKNDMGSKNVDVVSIGDPIPPTNIPGSAWVTGVGKMIERIGRSRLPLLFIIVLTMLVEPVCKIAGVGRILEKTLLVCYVMMFTWFCTMLYAGVLRL
ncbi:hypothetical protein CGMCC3_g3582 [Colletotrichum fructicola]|uniref:Uncharacterized protein n=1 Tax=Colletotrichum fructicola (strain Nara gc5) TaxID=1213859 RepID=A0A7J6JBD4_COLFN|nr:uncharacterized protein CGMCC3_g3582 [Colletotrichum fructicola]KAE9580763.1 hypothetical protein CGMCC3_g3582 [Colletotrichum fructicola]KAF4486630.1 hypothetical protein CGGC5_v005563 [Colletotrichum fructicola Nara gc5]